MTGALLCLLAFVMGADSQESDSAAGRLEGAHIRVVIEGSYALVLARYEVDRTGVPVVFEALRLPGQVVIVDRAVGPQAALEVEQLVEVRRITAPASPPGTAQFRIRYRVEENFSSIPVFVPAVPSTPGLEQVELEIIGAPSETNPENAVPPLQWGPGPALYAVIQDLPATIQLPFSEPTTSETPGFFLRVLLLVCLAGVAWAGYAAWSRRNRGAGAV
ncbi:MAG: hypothetical protein GTO46_06195 [Gemmatimonadetes bacterium]|nr:hypothetical protein [Gemmatimonadota bacterium]NIO31195.1 hypothetical protein [Gemmatimonadota bacterium]